MPKAVEWALLIATMATFRFLLAQSLPGWLAWLITLAFTVFVVFDTAKDMKKRGDDAGSR